MVLVWFLTFLVRNAGYALGILSFSLRSEIPEKSEFTSILLKLDKTALSIEMTHYCLRPVEGTENLLCGKLFGQPS